MCLQELSSSLRKLVGLDYFANVVTELPFFVDSLPAPDSNLVVEDHVLPMPAPNNSPVMDGSTLPVPTNPPTAQDWESYRPLFTQLYSEENRPWKEVQSILESDYGFRASKKMIMKRVHDWQLFKNLKKQEKENVVRIEDQQTRLGQTRPQVRLRGRVVDDHKIIRYRRAVGTPDTLAIGTKPAATLPRTIIDVEVDEPFQNHGQPRRWLVEKRASPQDVRNEQFTPNLHQSIAPPSVFKDCEIVFRSVDRSTDLSSNGKAGEVVVMVNKLLSGLSLLQGRKKRVAWTMIHDAFAMMNLVLIERSRLLLHFLFNLLCQDLLQGFDGMGTAVMTHFSQMSTIILGQNHPITVAFHVMANSLAWKEIAASAWEVQIDLFRQKLGATDDNTLKAELDVARNFVSGERYAEAEQITQCALRNGRERFGARNPFTTNAVSALCRCYRSQGYCSKSEAVLLSILPAKSGDELGAPLWT